MNVWVGPQYPNETGAQPALPQADLNGVWNWNCGPAGCLFNVFTDPTEHNDIAEDYPELRQLMLQRLDELNRGEFQPNRGRPDAHACKVARTKWKGFYGPFVDEKREWPLDFQEEEEEVDLGNEEAMDNKLAAATKSLRMEIIR